MLMDSFPLGGDVGLHKGIEVLRMSSKIKAYAGIDNPRPNTPGNNSNNNSSTRGWMWTTGRATVGKKAARKGIHDLFCTWKFPNG